MDLSAPLHYFPCPTYLISMMSIPTYVKRDVIGPFREHPCSALIREDSTIVALSQRNPDIFAKGCGSNGGMITFG